MIFIQLSQQLTALNALLLALSEKQYACNIVHLGNAGIGSHVRHIIELLQCTLSGYETGMVDYINRQRNLLLETDKELARLRLQSLLEDIRLPDKDLLLQTESSWDANANKPVRTTFFREIVYNTEHCIHHLALIKVALTELQLDITDANFGMAYSTIQYKAALTKEK